MLSSTTTGEIVDEERSRDLSAPLSQHGGWKRIIQLLTGFILGHSKDAQLETTMSTLEEKKMGESNLPQRRH